MKESCAPWGDTLVVALKHDVHRKTVQKWRRLFAPLVIPEPDEVAYVVEDIAPPAAPPGCVPRAPEAI